VEKMSKKYDLIQYVDAPIYGSIQEWPAMIQDQIYEALRRMEAKLGINLTITHSESGIDYADGLLIVNTYYIKVVAEDLGIQWH
jgi:hypothetical protein